MDEGRASTSRLLRSRYARHDRCFRIRRRRTFFSRSEESVHHQRIASVRIETGLIWAGPVRQRPRAGCDPGGSAAGGPSFVHIAHAAGAVSCDRAGCRAPHTTR